MKTLSHRVLLREEPEGGYTATVPTLPGCITYGETIPEAVTMAKEAIALYVESLIAHGEAIPTEESLHSTCCCRRAEFAHILGAFPLVFAARVQ